MVWEPQPCLPRLLFFFSGRKPSRARLRTSSLREADTAKKADVPGNGFGVVDQFSGDFLVGNSAGGPTTMIYFAAGPGGQAHGLFGSITAG